MTPCTCELKKCGCETNKNENKESVRNTKEINTTAFKKSRRPSNKRKQNRNIMKLKGRKILLNRMNYIVAIKKCFV